MAVVVLVGAVAGLAPAAGHPVRATTSLDTPSGTVDHPAGAAASTRPTPALRSADLAPGAAAYPLDQTFALHSSPGSARTLFIDLDGTNVSGTRWNAAADGHPALASGPQPGWSLDASPAFSDTERTVVQDVWQAVAEDYAPFDIDVTTEQPAADRLDRASTTDPVYGATALVTGGTGAAPRSTADDTLCGGTCSGIAYNGVFAAIPGPGTTHASWQPEFVFGERLIDARAIADAVSHEVGHTFGLLHDGTTSSEYYSGHQGGQGLWGAVMGAPANVPVTQWSRGEYGGANRAQDDLAVIGATSGAPTRVDDTGGTVGGALALPAPRGSIPATGSITTAGDVDVWSLGTCTGPVRVDAGPAAAYSPDLDLSVALLDAAGTPVAGPVDQPTTRTSRTVAAGLAASTSYDAGAGRPLWVAVDGVGSGDPATTGYSDYASLGRYLVSLTGSCSGASGTPGSPRGVVATASGRAVTVSWTPPAASGSSPVTSYVVTGSPGAGEVTVPAPTTTTTFAGLAPGATYSFTVSARNASGGGVPATAAVTVPALVPGTPSAMSAAASAGGVVSLRWGPPTDDGGAPVSGYHVSLAGLVDRDVAAGVTGITVSGVPAGGPLLATVQARNSAGLGTAAAAPVVVPGSPAVVPSLGLVSRPSVKGAARVGRRLTVDPGAWSVPVTLDDQWSLGRTEVRSATRRAFTPTRGQVGRKLSVVVTATPVDPAHGSPVKVTVAVGKVKPG